MKLKHNFESSMITGEKWIAMSTTLLKTQTEDNSYQTQTEKPHLKIDGILRVMEERRQHQTNTNISKWSQIEVCRKVRKQRLVQI